MTPIENLRKCLKAAHPDARFTLTPPLNKEGVWHLDVSLAGHHLVIEWSLANGFGVSSLGDDSYGERPDESYRSVEDTQRRVTQLLTGDERTSPPLGVLLSRLRESRGRTQNDLAAKLGIRQATVSGIERRNEIQFSTLRRMVEALGGILEVFAVFPDARYRLAARSVEFVKQYQAAELPDYTLVERDEFGGHFEEMFESLRNSGELSWATKVARDISDRHSILEVP